MAKTIVQASTRKDFIEHGSLRHASLLGLRKAVKEDALEIQGWTLVDPTVFGPQATETYLRETLRQKVSELNAGAPPGPQSEDPFSPNYHPPMWIPGDEPASGIV